jgi:hypothetical protein
MFTFNIEQFIYYIRNDRIHSAPVLAHVIVENAKEDWLGQIASEKLLTPFGKSREAYATCHGFVPVEDAFASKQDLINSLI